MYIDKSIIEELEGEFNSPLTNELICTIIDNASWITFEDVKQEWNDQNALLEDVFKKYFFIIEENTILFCRPDWFWSSVQEIQELL